ncbi:DgyrCDS7228 [Dimorphilus gyrociliatus]|uniref:DgyrCDS7228 n=1 Tax=Dimorphilus gyrociliatus TaxID=2664684 RepID=A0A7I8VVE2_9ANNE|nr:DgyrCDS7228 [Dimorphilus gyrociliatus]
MVVVPDIVRSIPHWKILEMRQQTQFLWSTYFSSVDKIVMTTLEIIKERIDTQAATRSKWVWNVAPGALATLPDFSESLKDYPFFRRRLRLHSTKNFTAVIYVSSEQSSVSPLIRLIKRLSKSTHLTKILLLWNKSTAPFRLRRNFANVKANIILKVINHVNERFYPHEEIDTDAVLSLDEDALLITDEIDFAFSVWQEFPDRIVGYPARSHYWHEAREQWMYSSAQKHHFSMVLTYASFYHKYYNYLYTHSLHTPLFNIVSTAPHCTHILMNFLVSHVTKRPPIKVLQRKISTANERMQPSESWMMERSADFVDSQSCMLNITKIFGYMPLKNSQVRIDPLLYKDHVSKHRKKYKTVENITWN